MGLGAIFTYFNQVCLLDAPCVCLTYLHYVPIGHHLGQALGDLGAGGAEQHHHAGRRLCVDGVKEAIHADARIALQSIGRDLKKERARERV